MNLLPNVCEWSSAPYLLFSDNIWGNFIYYSHLFPAITGLLLGTIVFLHNPRGKANISLFLLTLTFAVWCLIDLILWATDRPDLIMFFWSILIHFDLLIYVSAFYFIYTFTTNEWPKWWHNIVFIALFIPLSLFGHTPLNLVAFDYTNCWREALEGPLWQYYVYNSELIIALGILVYSFFWLRPASLVQRKKQILLAVIGTLLLLISFSFGNITGSIETNWELGQYGLFGMPIFAALLTYLIVAFKSFKIKIVATEALMIGLSTLVLSLLFVRKFENVQLIVSVTFILTTLLGLLLVRSARREAAQRQELEELTRKLASANKRLRKVDQMKSEFVSIASHQLRSPLTAIRGYASLLAEGSFGKIPKKATEAAERIHESSATMASSIEDFLNVSRIESGNLKYTNTDFNLNTETEHITDDKRREGVKAGLVVKFSSKLTKKQGIVNADIGKVRQILHNLINNALKYTEKGIITVTVREDDGGKRIAVDVTDTGIGMSEADMENIFEKFQRAENAHTLNSTGTGLGLYIAEQMAKKMDGAITATSYGRGEGSTFTFTLPLQM